jgi:hypothetical protein
MGVGNKAKILQLCPPKGEMNEPLWFVRTLREEGSITFELGTLQWSEPWEPFSFGVGPIKFLEQWEAEQFIPDEEKFTESWEAIQFIPDEEQFSETWEADVYIPDEEEFTETWEAEVFIPDTQQFFEQWEFTAVPHSGNWFLGHEWQGSGSEPEVVGDFANWTGVNPSFMTTIGEDDGQIWRLVGNTLPWELIHDPGNIENFDAIVEAFGLMFAFGRDFSGNLEVWTSSTGLSSSFVFETEFSSEGDGLDAIVFASDLYLSTKPNSFFGTPVLRSRTSGGAWSIVTSLTSSDQEISSLEIFSGQLYMASIGNDSGGGSREARVYDLNGVEKHVFTGRRGCSDIISFGGFLYAAVFDDVIGTDVLEVWRTPDPETTPFTLHTTIDSGVTGELTSQFATDGVNLFLGLATSGVFGSGNRAQVWTFDTSTWQESVDFNDAPFNEDSNEIDSVNSMGYDAVSGRIYAGLGGQSGHARIYNCPTADAGSPACVGSECGGGGGGGGGG